MAIISKVFDGPLAYGHCSQILHPGSGCGKFILANTFSNGKFISLYFLPIACIPLVLQGKRVSRKKLRDTCKYYLQCVLYCTITVSLTINSICICRKLTEKFTKYSVFLIPGTIGGLHTCWLMPDKILRMINIALGQCNLDICMKQSSNGLIQLLLRSKLLQLLLFSLNSVLILEAKQKKEYQGFWFIEPMPKPNLEPEEMEPKTFFSNWLKGLKRYVLIGLFLDMYSMKRFKLPQSKAISSLSGKVFEVLKAFKPKTTAFFVSYITLYKFSIYLMAHHCDQVSATLRHRLASFIGGLSFLFLSKPTLLQISLTSVIEITWTKLCNLESEPNTPLYNISRFLDRVPMKMLLFPVMMAVFGHKLLYNFSQMSPLSVKLSRVMAGNLLENVVLWMQSHSEEELIEIVRNRKIFGYFE